MREHMGLYRGRRLDNGEWVEGNLITLHDGRCYVVNNKFGACLDSAGNFIMTSAPFVCEVAPETVGECTGLRDKNGKLIFEGDIVAQNWYDYNEPADDSFGEVVFCEYDCSFSVIDVEKNGIVPLGRCHSYHWEAEIIGNVHDNPELLEGGAGGERR